MQNVDPHMLQLPIPFNVARIGACGVCCRSARLNARICRSCEAHYGRRTAELLARARHDRAFAEACFLRLGVAEQRQFLAVLRPDVARRGVANMGPGIAKCRAGGRMRVVPLGGGSLTEPNRGCATDSNR